MGTRKEFHIAEYCTRAGEYGEIFKSANFAAALEKAADFLVKTDSRDYLYIGVKGNTDLFAICYVDKKYIEDSRKQP
jgi:hypothetical protein